MKKFISGLVIGALLMSSFAFASGTSIQVTMQSLKFLISGEASEQTGFIHEGTAYVPVRYISETLGKDVKWNASTRTIEVNEKSQVMYDNGVYRGTFEDGGYQQVGVQFTLEDNIITNISFRHLFYKDVDFRKLTEEDMLFPVLKQHNQILEYLKDKHIDAMSALYNPGEIIEDVDTFTGATIRGSKIHSAMQDALNRGVYNPTGPVNKSLATFENGTYRGVFSDGGIQQVSIQFKVDNGTIKDLSYRQLAYKDIDYRKLEEDNISYPVLLQHNQILEYLNGKPLESIFDLHNPGDIIDDIDAFTGATVRSNKVLSAIRDGLNRGVYTPVDAQLNRSVPIYPNGKYRGTFADTGVQQVSIEFSLEENIIKNPTFRHLFYKDLDYRKLKEGDILYPVTQQYSQLLNHLDGKPLETIFELYSPGEIIDDIDTFTGATIRANKVLSAIQDALNRGLYK